MKKKKQKVLIICTGNSCRSQMAEGFINHNLSDSWQAFSAGVNPTEVNPKAVKVMAEVGVDISGHRSKSISEFFDRDDLDLIITVCDHARDTCPVFPGDVEHAHLGFEDPARFEDLPDEIALPKFHEIRDKIRTVLTDLLKRLN